MSYNCLGLAAARTRDIERGLICLEEALAIRQRCFPAQHPFTAMSYSSLGSYYEGVSKFFNTMKMQEKAFKNGSRALDMHKQALSIYKNSVPPTHGILSNSYKSVGRLYLNQEQWQEAIEHFTACATIQRKRTSDDLADTLHQLGKAYSGKGDYRQAIASYEEALTVAQKSNDNTLVRQLREDIERNKQRIS
jgi:tetratricopeptide (TPR) repeat protein